MIPVGFAALEAQLLIWMLAMVRPGAAMLFAPGFGAASLPIQLRTLIAMAIGMAAAAHGSVQLPAAGLLSFDMMATVFAELFIGAAIGVVVQLGVAAAHVAGELLSGAMGLNFSTMIDPLSGHGSPTISQALTMLATTIFFASDFHLSFLQAIYASYGTLPVATMPPLSIGWTVALSGGTLLSMGLAIALPLLFAVLLVQFAMATLARAAPQLNLFSVGLPTAVFVGMILMVMALPVMATGLSSAIAHGQQVANQLVADR